jgi:hypothetical protein
MLEHIPTKITNEENFDLERPIIEEENICSYMEP